MAEDISPALNADKQTELRRRLTSPKVDQVLPAEMELAILWGLNQLGEIEVEPELQESNQRPEARSEFLFSGQNTYVEVAALSNASLSGEEDMSRISSQISQFANQIQRGLGKHLFFTFNYALEHKDKRISRRRMANPKFILTEEVKDLVRSWLALPPEKRKSLRVAAENTDVIVEWREHKQQFQNFFSPMPVEAQHLDANPLWEVLRNKSSQLKHSGNGTLKCLILADAGSSLLRQLEQGDRLGRTFSGQEIINHFLTRYPKSFDIVCVFSPSHSFTGVLGQRGPLQWKVSYFTSGAFPHSLEGLQKLATSVPPPAYEGYQARSLQQQNSFVGRSRGLYADTKLTMKGWNMTVDISSRAVLALLAGHMTHAEFLSEIQMDRPDFPNQFSARLKAKDILKSVRVIPGGLDEFDDKLSFDFEPDPAFAPILNEILQESRSNSKKK
jgi:hypothetical protein